MKRALLIVCFTILAAFKAKADSWFDPTWRKMLDESDVIALVEYVSDGDQNANARIVSIYKGNLKIGDILNISGFSNRYGPIDKMKKGDRYIVFLTDLNHNPKYESYRKYLIENDPEAQARMQNSNAYSVASPTSGDLKVKGKSVQYDLTQTTFYQNQRHYSLKQFEGFLSAYFDRKKAPKLIATLRSAMVSDSDPDQVAQHLMQLYFLGFNEYDENFEEFVDYGSTPVKYALAQLMGNIRTEESRNILLKLLKDPNTLVQGEVVRQLEDEPTEIVGPLFLETLKTANANDVGNGNLMNPVMNRIDGGRTAIIAALAQMKYRPAIPELLKLLNTSDFWQFKLVISALKDIGSKQDYIPTLNALLLQKNETLANSISELISKDSLVECLPSLKYFISNCNRNSSRVYSWVITDLSKFGDKETASFLLFDYDRFLSYKDTLESGKQNQWTNSYVQAFTNLKTREARPLIYRSIYDWTGLNRDFITNPDLFAIKRQAEETIREKFQSSPRTRQHKLSHVIAFIRNTDKIKSGEKPQIGYLLEVSLGEMDESGMGHAEKASISETTGIPAKDIFVRYHGVYYSDIQERFSSTTTSVLDTFAREYAPAVPHREDADFLQALLDHGYFRNDVPRVEKAIAEIRTNLK